MLLLLQVNQTVDTKLKEANQYVDQKREGLTKAVEGSAANVHQTTDILSKSAKGLLHSKLRKAGVAWRAVFSLSYDSCAPPLPSGPHAPPSPPSLFLSDKIPPELSARSYSWPWFELGYETEAVVKGAIGPSRQTSRRLAQTTWRR